MSSAGQVDVPAPHHATAACGDHFLHLVDGDVDPASTSIVSAVPAGEVIAREEVLGMVRPCAATIGTTI